MLASDYLRIKLQSDRQLSIYLQRGVNSFLQATKQTISDISSGIERASWYSSCLIPRHGDICSELITEEKRMALSIASLFKHDDIFLYMLIIYFEMIEKDRQEGNKNGSAQRAVKNVSGYTANMAANKFTRNTIAWSLSKALSGSEAVSKVVAERVAGKSPYVVLALQVFGIEHKAALAARKLKILEPEYYALLYAAQLEMLYYFIEPVLEIIIQKVKTKIYDTLEDLYEDIGVTFNV